MPGNTLTVGIVGETRYEYGGYIHNNNNNHLHSRFNFVCDGCSCDVGNVGCKEVKHLGDITKISGDTVPTVDCAISGSPCQDLSVAGKRAGLDGERSGLFMEQIRIIKEMRENDRRCGRTDELIRPRYMLWENVPGALSSNKGEDFRIVLEEIAKNADENAVIPRPANGKWASAGCILADGWSVAWRILDAQFWGVPQRRRRIALVADFGGKSAPEILFERKGVSRDTESCGTPRKGITADTQGSLGVYDRARVARGGVISLDRAAYNQGQNAQFDIGVSEDGTAQTVVAKGPGAVAYVLEKHPQDSRFKFSADDVSPVIAIEGNGSRPSHKGNGYSENDTMYTLNSVEQHGIAYATSDGVEKAGTLDASYYKGIGVRNGRERTYVVTAETPYNDAKGFPLGFRAENTRVYDDTATTVCNGTRPGFCNGIMVSAGFCDEASAQTRGIGFEVNKVPTLRSGVVPSAVCGKMRYIVRRLTPLECERLQGFPDNWTDIGEYTDTTGKKRKTSDAARYKALGNSIALPQWKWIIKRICANYPTDATMASLFDGIGGFPYLWEQINGKGSCLWASEIEEFPIAVTKARIGE